MAKRLVGLDTDGSRSDKMNDASYKDLSVVLGTTVRWEIITFRKTL